MRIKNRLVMFVCLLMVIGQTVSARGQGWVRRYDGPTHRDDYAYAITVDSVGNIYVTGASDGNNSAGLGSTYDYLTLKYDPAGNIQWVRRYNGPANGQDDALAIAVDSVGNVYVTGYSFGGDQRNGGTGYDFATVKYDATGHQKWVRRYNGPDNGDDYAIGMAADSAGNVYVIGAGGTYDGATGEHFYFLTIKYDTDGHQKWLRRFVGASGTVYTVKGMVLDSAANVYVTGWCPEGYVTLKYDTNGNSLWHTYTTGGEPNGIAVDSVGNVYVVGDFGDAHTAQGIGFGILKYDTTGHLKWIRRYDGPGNGFDEAIAVAVDSAGNVYVTGHSLGTGSVNEYATLKYDPNGNQKWVQRYSGPGKGGSYPFALTVDSAGSVSVTGNSTGVNSQYDYATVKYDTDGNLKWVQRYNGRGNAYDYGFAITVDSNGNVYVTGFAYGGNGVGGSLYDVVTIKYAP